MNCNFDYLLWSNLFYCIIHFYLKGYKNKSLVAGDEECGDNTSLAKLFKEQAKMLQQVQSELSEEKNKTALLSGKMEDLLKEFRSLKEEYTRDTGRKTEEMNKLRNTLEAKSELQASLVDELRFQMQSMRNKIDTSRGLLIENGASIPSQRHLKQSSDLVTSPKKLLRNNSEDSLSSTGSNPCLLSRVSAPHRAEYVWRINSFTKKLKKIQSGSYEDPSRSEPFMTGPNGYRLSMWAYLNGRGKGAEKCLSIYVRVMGGEYDPILTWPVKPCYTFHLISQSQELNKRLDLVRVRDLSIKHSGISRPQKDDKSIIVGFDDFIVHEDIEKKEYLENDSLFIKCIVEIP